jgi:excisionase family DNA binding protein
MQGAADRDRLLTVREACAILTLRERTVRSWIAGGKLPAVRLSRRAIRVRLGDVEDFIRAHTDERSAGRARS